MISTYTAKYTKATSGYMGQLIEWSEVITEGKTLEECKEMLQDALNEMISAYRQQNKEIPAQAFEELQNVLLNKELGQLSREAEAHLEKEFENYGQLYPRE